ncbi:unnamed protein product, partial [Choristocarpus tenellus]
MKRTKGLNSHHKACSLEVAELQRESGSDPGSRSDSSMSSEAWQGSESSSQQGQGTGSGTRPGCRSELGQASMDRVVQSGDGILRHEEYHRRRSLSPMEETSSFILAPHSPMSEGTSSVSSCSSSPSVTSSSPEEESTSLGFVYSPAARVSPASMAGIGGSSVAGRGTAAGSLGHLSGKEVDSAAKDKGKGKGKDKHEEPNIMSNNDENDTSLAIWGGRVSGGGEEKVKGSNRKCGNSFEKVSTESPPTGKKKASGLVCPTCQISFQVINSHWTKTPNCAPAGHLSKKQRIRNKTSGRDRQETKSRDKNDAGGKNDGHRGSTEGSKEKDRSGSNCGGSSKGTITRSNTSPLIIETTDGGR